MEEQILNSIFDVFEAASKDEQAGKPKDSISKFRTFISLVENLKASSLGKRNPEGIVNDLEEAANVARDRVRVLTFYEGTIPLGAVSLDPNDLGGTEKPSGTSTPLNVEVAPPSLKDEKLREAVSKMVATPAIQSKIQTALDQTVFQSNGEVLVNGCIGPSNKLSDKQPPISLHGINSKPPNTHLLCQRCEKPGRFQTESKSSSLSSDLNNPIELSSLLRCGKCRKVYYCNIACQKADWGSHKSSCSSYRKE